MSIRPKTLFGKFILTLIPPLVFCYILFSVVMGALIYLDSREAVAQRMEDLAVMQSRALANSLWHLDFNFIRQHIPSLLLYPGVVGVKVEESNGDFEASVGNSYDRDCDGCVLLVSSITHKTMDGSIPIGRLNIIYKQEGIMKALAENLLRDSSLMLLLLLAVVMSVILATRRIIDAPLNKMLDAIREGRSIESPKTSGSPPAEEFNELMRAYNTLLSDFKSNEERLGETVRELALAKDSADEASKAKSSFLASMSHEIRTPLNAILGVTDLLAEAQLSNKQQHYVRICNSAGQGLLDIINDILDISKIEAGKIELEKVEFDLEETVSKVCKALAISADEKGLELCCRIAPDCPGTVVGDPLRLRQVLMNLVGNGVKFTEYGEVLLEVSLCGEEEKVQGRGQCLRFMVKDTGIGIQETKMERIFERFSQADSSTTRRFGGTGLGLSISRHLVSLMGGRVWLESRERKGSSFYFTAYFGAGSVISIPPPDLSGSKVLVVDDNLTQCSILKELLRNTGCEAFTDTGLENLAQQVALHEPLDLVLLDCGLKPLDQRPALEILRGKCGYSGKVVFLAGALNLEASIKDESSGVLIKPILPGTFYSTIKDIMSRESVPHEHQVQLRGGFAGEPRTSEKTKSAMDTYSQSRILVVEDSEYNAFVIKAFVRELSKHVELAVNGSQGLAFFKEGKYDIVLMDIEMPLMDGLEATRAIRDWERVNNLPCTPVIAMTAYALSDDIERCIDAGCDVHMAKPLQKSEVLSTVKRLLDERRNAADTTS